MKSDPEDPCAEANKYSFDQKRASKIDAVDSMIAKKTEKKIFKDTDQNLGKALHNAKTKMIPNFVWESSVSINSKSNDEIFFQAKCLCLQNYLL